jgi:DNA invertase Pin-like site-specific DNA recombinase
MIIGYARVSTNKQNTDMQIDSLKSYGCEKIYVEKASGSTKDRTELLALFKQLRKGDNLVIYKLDRLGRSLKDLISIVNTLADLQVSLVSISDGIDTTTPVGRFTFNIFASIAEFERDVIRERTLEGLKAARSRGRIGGRPSGFSRKVLDKIEDVCILYQNKVSVSDICKRQNISSATLYKILKYRGIK